MANQAPRVTGLLAGQCLRPFLHVVTHRLTHTQTHKYNHTHTERRPAGLGGEEQR